MRLYFYISLALLLSCQGQGTTVKKQQLTYSQPETSLDILKMCEELMMHLDLQSYFSVLLLTHD